MSAKQIINSGNTQLYNQVYCNFMPTNSLGFNTCTNCNFTDIKPFSSTQQSSESSCNTACSNNPVCVAYTYNTQNGNCDNFNSYPNVINYNSSNNNSGYFINENIVGLIKIILVNLLQKKDVLNKIIFPQSDKLKLENNI